MSSYFGNIGSAVSSLWDGMRVTLHHFTGKKRLNATLQYPHERWPIPDRHIGFDHAQYNVIRSRLHVDIDDCIGCLQCERVCPVDCIKIETLKVPKETELGAVPGATQTSATSNGTAKRLLVTRFDIDMAECMYCNLCVYPCPEECIYMVGGPNEEKHPIDYEFSLANRDGLVYQFATATDVEVSAVADLAGMSNPRLRRQERRDQYRQPAAAPAAARPEPDGEAQPAAEAEPAAKPKSKQALTEPKMDLALLGAIEDRVTRGLAKKAAFGAVRAGKAAPEVAEQTKAALDAAGKLTPEVATVVAQLAEATIQQPGGAEPAAAEPDAPAAEEVAAEPAAEAVAAEEPAPSKGAEPGGKLDLSILNGIQDRVARGKAKSILNKTLRQGGSARAAAAEIKATLADLGKLDSETEAVLAQLEA